jgi:hypothetical protein
MTFAQTMYHLKEETIQSLKAMTADDGSYSTCQAMVTQQLHNLTDYLDGSDNLLMASHHRAVSSKNCQAR